MNHRLLAIDLDGTLLVGDQVPKPHLAALRAALDHGFKVVIATARWCQMAEAIQRNIGNSDLIIACNGAQVFDPIARKDLVDLRLPSDFANELGEIMLEADGFACATLSSESLVVRRKGWEHKTLPSTLRSVSAWPDFTFEAPRIFTAQGSNLVDQVKALIAQRTNDDILVLESLGPTGQVVLTITARAANKGAGLRSVCEALNIGVAETIAFGDSEGDLDLFAAAGMAVAMGQASEAVKSAADYVSDSNTDFGIATFLSRYFEGEFSDHDL